MKRNTNDYDAIIIGGGFYGCMIALELRKEFEHILILEKEKTLLTKASYNNQARVHNGYHYPRNFITALRSHRNYATFIADFNSAVEDHHTMIYSIARGNSKVTSEHFIRLCKQIEAPLQQAPSHLRKLFNDRLIEDVFLVDEIVFNAAKIRKVLVKKLLEANIHTMFEAEVERVVVKPSSKLSILVKQCDPLTGGIVINATYANINSVLQASSLPLLPMKYEYTEMPIVTMPEPLQNVGITIMDGPFFSLMPFPDMRKHSFHHVRYTPHVAWENEQYKIVNEKDSRFLYMKKDAMRYIPLLKNLQYHTSLYEVKTVLKQNESNDGRPILFRKDYGLKNFHVVMGGKIDNIYDVLNKMRVSNT